MSSARHGAVGAASLYGSAMLSFSRGGVVGLVETGALRNPSPRNVVASNSRSFGAAPKTRSSRRALPIVQSRGKAIEPARVSHAATKVTTGCSLHRRREYATVTPSQPYEAVVVGAGPAGITCVGNLLERTLSPILWVDDRAFSGGRVNRMYREVPSNTKVKTFMDYALGFAPFRKIVSGVPQQSRYGEAALSPEGKADKLHTMRELDPEKGCRLGHAADMCLMLTEGLKRTAGVKAQEGRVAEARFDEGSSLWSIQLQTGEASESAPQQPVQAKRIVLCTGSSPNNNPLPVDIPGARNLDLDTALSPTRLSSALSPRGATTISVIGASHSAILVLMNLYNLAATSKPDLRVRWLTRHPLRYAVFMDGWILRDNTGLKGEAADWAKANLEPEVYEQSNVSKYIERIDYEAGREKDVFLDSIPGSDFYIQAIGYNRDPIPNIRLSSGQEVQPQFDHEKGTFNYVKESQDGKVQSVEPLPGMFGAGIAFPERVKDPHGNVELAVGFLKFQKSVKRIQFDT